MHIDTRHRRSEDTYIRHVQPGSKPGYSAEAPDEHVYYPSGCTFASFLYLLLALLDLSRGYSSYSVGLELPEDLILDAFYFAIEQGVYWVLLVMSIVSGLCNAVFAFGISGLKPWSIKAGFVAAGVGLVTYFISLLSANADQISHARLGIYGMTIAALVHPVVRRVFQQQLPSRRRRTAEPAPKQEPCREREAPREGVFDQLRTLVKTFILGVNP